MIVIQPILEDTVSSDTLYNLQLIANTFTDAIEKNNCNLKLVIGFHQQLDNAIRDLTDLEEALNDKPKTVVNNRPNYTYIVPNDPRFKESSLSIKQASDVVKQKCIDCKLRLPQIKFDNKLRFSFDNLLKLQTAYENIIKEFNKPNYCHLGFAFETACGPDIIKLIALLLNAYIAILAFKKLSSFSLNSFIKGLIASLLAKIVGSLTVSINFSNTGLPCLLSALENIAKLVPSPENFRQQIAANVRNESGFFPDSGITDFSLLKQQLVSNEITKEEYQQIISDYQKANTPESYYLNALKNQSRDVENGISEVFTYANDVVKQAQDELNSFINSIFGVITYFECEATRASADFAAILELSQKIINLINALSAILVVILKRQINGRLCKETNAPTSNNFTKEDIKDIVQEYTGNLTVLDDPDGISSLIYDKPVRQVLPKLNLFSCNLEEFTKAHELDNAIDSVVKDLIDSQNDNNGIVQNAIDLADLDFNSNTTDKVKRFDIPGYTQPEQGISSEDDRDKFNNAINIYDSYVNDIRELVDFIYKNPLKSIDDDFTEESEDAEDLEDILKEITKELNTVDTNKNRLSQKQQECLTIEDVLNTMKNINF